MSSIYNKEIKIIKKLSNRKYRSQLGLFIIEGIHTIEMAIQAGYQLESVFSTDHFQDSESGARIVESLIKGSTKLFLVTDSVFQSISETQSPQGILAIAKMRQNANWRSDVTGNTIIILDRIQDPGNLGTIIRSADSAGADFLVSIKGTVDVYNSKVIRSSAGSFFNIPVYQDIELEDFHGYLKENKYFFVAADMHGRTLYYQEDLNGPIALVVGNEGQGLGEETHKYIDSTVRIPLLGKSESLNVSVACGILLYEIARQRKQI